MEYLSAIENYPVVRVYNICILFFHLYNIAIGCAGDDAIHIHLAYTTVDAIHAFMLYPLSSRDASIVRTINNK